MKNPNELLLIFIMFFSVAAAVTSAVFGYFTVEKLETLDELQYPHTFCIPRIISEGEGGMMIGIDCDTTFNHEPMYLEDELSEDEEEGEWLDEMNQL